MVHAGPRAWVTGGRLLTGALFPPLRRTGIRQLLASVFVLLAQACSIEQPVSGPMALTAEWKTVDPPEPLRVGSKELQEVCLQVVGTTTDVDFEEGRLLVNGQWHTLGGEAVDDAQTNHDLRVGSLGGDTVCLYRAGAPVSGPDFDPERTIVRLRLRSDPPLQLGQIRWSSHDQK
jgi:hypothetical protein